MDTPAPIFSRLMARNNPLLELAYRMTVVSITATCLCTVVLLLVLVAYIHPASRSHLDRVSFRLIVLALLCNLIMSIALVASFVGTVSDCLGWMWTLQFFGQLCSDVSLCVGLNLLLVMVWRQDGRKLEKWYFIGSIIHAMIITLPALFAKAWGRDPLAGTCGYTDIDKKKRFSWRMATLTWPVLAVVGELITFVWILVYMVRTKAFSGKYLKSLNRIGSYNRATVNARRSTKYRMVVLRIALYPLSAAIAVILAIVGDIYLNRKDASIEVSAVLIPIEFFVRPLLYCLLTLVDPSVVRALRTLFNSARGHIPEATSIRTDTGHTTQPISINTVVAVSHAYPNEYELDEASPPGSDVKDNMGHHSNDVILPTAPSPTKDFSTKYPPSDTGKRSHGVTLDLPRAASDVDSELGTGDPPSRLRGTRRTRRLSEASDDSSEFLKQL